MEIGIGDEVTLVNKDTYVTGAIRGMRLVDEEVEVIWIARIDFGFYMGDGWLIAEDFSEDELAEIEKLNKMLEGEEEENGEVQP